MVGVFCFGIRVEYLLCHIHSHRKIRHPSSSLPLPRMAGTPGYQQHPHPLLRCHTHFHKFFFGGGDKLWNYYSLLSSTTIFSSVRRIQYSKVRLLSRHSPSYHPLLLLHKKVQVPHAVHSAQGPPFLW